MNTEPRLIRILAVDDHPLLRDGIAALISIAPDMQLVGACSNGREAVEQFRTLRPDVTLMDLQMPVMSGLEAIAVIRGEFSDARIIVLTTYAGDVQVVRAFKAGASAFLVKNLAHQELLDTIRSVHRGRKAISPEVSSDRVADATDDELL
jgi:Response regulator containing a CheY-like receiver domain and an HTH DNA-binding domain